MLHWMSDVVMLGADAAPVGPVAPAAGEGTQMPPPQNPLLMFVPMILILVVFFWMSHRSQKKRDRERDDMLNAIKPKDKVVTIGGIHGRVVSVKDDGYVIRVDEDKDVRMTVSKSAISRRLEGDGKE